LATVFYELPQAALVLNKDVYMKKNKKIHYKGSKPKKKKGVPKKKPTRTANSDKQIRSRSITLEGILDEKLKEYCLSEGGIPDYYGFQTWSNEYLKGFFSRSLILPMASGTPSKQLNDLSSFLTCMANKKADLMMCLDKNANSHNREYLKNYNMLKLIMSF
jgi:hypothetical protein